MKKLLFFALAALTLSFIACDQKDKQKDEPNDKTQKEDIIPASEYDGVYVSDSIMDNGDLYPHHTFWTVLNSEEVEIHGWGVCKWKAEDHFFTITIDEEKKISLELMFEPVDNKFVFYVGEGGVYLNVPEDAMLYMQRLPQPEGNKLPVNEANILGKWRTTYEINASYDESGKKVDETKFYHGWQIWDIQADGVATAYSDPYSYDGWWALDGEKLALYTGAKPATMKPNYFYQVELYSNYMHLISYTYREDGQTLSSSNEQFLYRVK